MAELFIEGFESPDVDVDRAEIEASTDERWLADLYVLCVEKAEEIKIFIGCAKETGVADEAWLRRAGQKTAYCVLGSRWVERRLLTLGHVPPYLPTDPRAVTIRNLERKIERLERENAQLGGERAAA